ncbi:hypothetical protein J6S55_03365 [Candidatus Saccharibacteria bacterium]|nr:hypothetical protein [Candidatus Saccharibacteria bacterium]
MKELDKDLLAEVGKITGIENGAKLKCVAGAIYATVFLGKMPIKEDLADFLGVSKRVVMETIHEVSIYPLATRMSLEGLYISTEEEPVERTIARKYLATMFDPDLIESTKEYIGYDTILEYLWQIADGSEDSINDYIRSRFESGLKIRKKLQAFALLVYQHNQELASSSYGYICEVLANDVRRARNEAMQNNSAKKAKKRLKEMMSSK